MTGHSRSHASHGDETPAGGFFERPPPVRPRTQGHKHRARTASGKRPGTRGGSSRPTSAEEKNRVNQTCEHLLAHALRRTNARRLTLC